MKYVFKKKRNLFLAAILDFLGYAALGLSRHRRRKNIKPEPKHVLVIRMDHIGDVLLATAVPKAVKEGFPACRVSFLTASWAAPLLENNPFVDEVIIYDAPWFAKKRYKRGPGGLSFMGLVRKLKRSNFDAALGLRGDLRENLIMALAGITERVGYGITGGGFLLTKEVLYRRLAHESERVAELLRALGAGETRVEPRIYFSSLEEAALPAKLLPFGLSPADRCIVFQADAGTTAKEWSPGVKKDFLNMLLRSFPDYKILQVGSGRERLEASDSRLVDLSGKTSLRDLCLVVRSAKAFVGFDSGPTHIAAALGVPTVFLYSGTNAYEQWKPLFDNAFVLRHPVACSPCGLEVCNVKGHPCMSGIKPERALKILERIL